MRGNLQLVTAAQLPKHGADWTRVIVVADTHIPDQAAGLPPGFLEELKQLSPQAIVHAGDICSPGVLRELSTVAPVLAVRGNRDVVLAWRLPLVAQATYGDVRLAVMHGHGGYLQYFREKLHYLQEGYRFARYRDRMLAAAPDAKVYVFGHTHAPELQWHDQRLFFNPGSLIGSRYFPPLYGVLEISPAGEAEGKHISIEGYARKGRHWVAR